MVDLFHFSERAKTKKSFFEATTDMPVHIIVVITRHKVIGLGVAGDRAELVQYPNWFFIRQTTEEDVAKELLRRLGVPESEWEKIINSKKPL